jgi:PAS domain S-box-containing protein
MEKKSSFIKAIQFWGIVVLIGMSVSFVVIDLISSYHDFNLHADQMRADHTMRHKQIIKHEVERVVDMIRYEKKQSKKLTKSKIKSRIYEVYSIAQHIYQKNKTFKSKDDIQKMIMDAIRPMRFEQGNGYYFISSLDGRAVLFPSKPELEGKNLSDVQDMRGQYITKDIIKIVEQSGEGFYQYHWTKPNAEGDDFKKISFIKQLGIYDWFIGTGLYVADVENKIKADLLSTISRIRFGKEGYIFVNRLNGDALVSNGKIVSGTKKLWEVSNKNSVKVKNIFEKEYNAALKPGGDYIYYFWEKLTDSNQASPKTSFILGIPELQWLAGAGVYLDDVENDIAVMRIELINQTKQKIVYFILIAMGVSAIIILCFNWLNRIFNNDLSLFFSFFNRAAYSDKKIDRGTIKFVELDQIAEYANKMLADRKHVEESLKKSEKKYRHLFKNAPAGIYEIDFIKGRFITVNEGMCIYSGYSKEEFLSMNPLDLLTKESQNAYIERLGKLFSGENLPGNVEYNIIKKDGQKICILLNSDFIYENGQLTGAMVVAQDITELKQAEKDKIKAQKIAGEEKKLALVGQIAGKMAHDFNNILGIIMGNTELSLIDCKDAQARKTLELIFEQTLRGRNLTKNLVAFAKDQEPKQQFFKINEKIELVLNLLKKDLEGIDTAREGGHRMPDLLADSGMIEHALVNLVQNAIHATSMVEQPEIIFRTFHKDKDIYIEIEDNGCGIPEEALDRIYEPAFTMKGSSDITNSYKPGIKGTGYGMANVKKYIEQHKGNILIDSKVGKGTKITVTLPVIKKELTQKEIKEIQKNTFYSGKNILLVEDEQAISDVQYKILTNEPCNHQVDIAATGQMAIDLFNRNKYDFVSLDYILPGELNGMDVYKQIRLTDDTIPILFVSGNLDFLESIKELKNRDSFIDHASKPWQNKDYVKAINELLGKT